MANEDKLIESKLKYFIHLILFSAFMYFLSIERDMWFYFFGAIYLVFVFYPIWYWIDKKIANVNAKIYSSGCALITEEDKAETKRIRAIYKRRRKKEDEEKKYSYSDPWAEEQKRRNKEYEEYARYEQAKKFNDSFANNRRF